MTAKSPASDRAPIARSAVDFANLVNKAVADGADPATLALRLTLRDESEMKRNRIIAVSDISFAGGQMRFLGVRVLKSQSLHSDLLSGEDAAQAIALADAPPPPPVAKKAAKPRVTKPKVAKAAKATVAAT